MPGECTGLPFASVGSKDTEEVRNEPQRKVYYFGKPLVDKVKQLIHEGNIRKVRLLHEGRTVIEIPLTIGAPAAAIAILAAPVLAALVTECTIEVEKIEKS